MHNLSFLRIFALLLVLLPTACRRVSVPEVVVYTSVDQTHGEPVLKAFEARTGIRVRAVYDVEAVKTVGLANRIIEERNRPRADVFWNSEILQTLRLERENVLESYRPRTAEGLPPSHRPAQGNWTALGGRARVFLVDKRQLKPDAYPTSLSDLVQHSVQPIRRGLALPLFGTTLTHAAALYVAWGPQRARGYFADLKARGVRFLEGNASVRDAVVRGELAFGLTDSDDAEGALVRGSEVAVAEINSGAEGEGTLVIPSSVALVKGGPHTREGKVLVDFLASAEVESMLVKDGFWQVAPRHPGASRSLPRATVKSMKVDWNRVLDELPRASRELREIFTR